MILNGIIVPVCVCVQTDLELWAGFYGGVGALIRRKAPEIIPTRRVYIRRASLASQNTSPPLNTALETVIKVVDYFFFLYF